MDYTPDSISSAMNEAYTHTESSNGPAPLPESSVANAATDPKETMFNDINKDQLLRILRAWKKENTTDGKAFFSTYPLVWDECTDLQKAKTKLFWFEKLKDPHRIAIKVNADAALLAGSNVTKEREAQSNFNDYARLLHLKKDGRLATTWRAAFDQKTRNELDDKEGYCDPYDTLAESFNDYEEFKYVNASFPKKHKDVNGIVVVTSEDESLIDVAKRCVDINPNDSARPKRNGEWVKVKWKELNSSIAKQYAKYNTSGRQDGSAVEKLWVEFIDSGQEAVSVVIYYVITLFNLSELNTIGKILPAKMQANTTIINIETDNEAAAESHKASLRMKKTAQKRRERKAKRERLAEGDLDSSFEGSEDNSASITKMLDERLKEHNQIQENMFTFNWMMAHGSSSNKKQVRAVMAQKLKLASEGMDLKPAADDGSDEDSLFGIIDS